MGLTRDLRWALDPATWAREAVGFRPDACQERILGWEGQRLILNWCRQSGKSTTTAVLALHRALYRPDSLILLVSPSMRQSGELFRKVTDMMARLEATPTLVEDNKLACQLGNRSRVVSLPSSEGTIRGFSGASLIIEDEASRVPDALHHAITPMLAVSGGQLILMSTPWGRRSHFFETWENGGREWQRVKVDAYECPRITAAFLEEEKRSMPASVFASEYLCQFVENEMALFAYEDIQAMFTDEYEAWNL